MLVEQLALAYKCHNSIGNSIDLKEMMSEVLRTFVSESYAIYAEFLLLKENKNLEKIDSFGKISSFDANKYLDYNEKLNLIIDDDFELRILKINLDNGILYIVSKNVDTDCSFFMSMFDSLLPKLNLSVNACLNFQKLEETNELLKKQKEELIKANKTKDVFLANMSHELKTPLNAITVISTIMSKNKDNSLNDSQVKNMAIIKKCAEDLLVLINDILDISKIEANVLKIDLANLNIKNLLDDLFDSFEEIATLKNIKLIKIFKIQDFYLYSDEKRVSQIIKNFLTNAIKFTSKGSVTIKLEELKDSFLVEIIDTGIGIKEEDLSTIFERFKQIDDSRTRKYGGTGLGLAISKELALLLNCEIGVSSEFGRGSKFWLDIPKNPKIKKLNKKVEIKESKEKKIELKNIDKNIFILHSNSIEQFKISVFLKKLALDIHPIFNQNDFNQKLEAFKKESLFFIIDKKIENFETIFEKCKLNNIELIVLDDETVNEKVLEKLKDYFSISKN